MAVHAVNEKSFYRPRPQEAQVHRFPAAIKGIDGRANLATAALDTCVYCFNIVPSEYGMRVRKGYREWAVDIETAPGLGLGVRSIVPFSGQSVGADKLFAVTNEGIWDVTVFNTPVLDQAFVDQSDAAGYVHYAHYVTDAEDDVLWVADSANGLFEYDPTLDTWSVPTITGPDPALISFIVEHKQRVWMFEKNSSTAWYLPIGSISGTATAFFFGSKFRHGGELVGLYNWTVDGGDGVDDYLVGVSRAGDVIPYQGEDPADTTWSNVGTFFIGEMPFGTNSGDEYGGELYLLSQFGLVAMSDLLKGVSPINVSENSIAFKIARFIRDDMVVASGNPGWQIKFNGAEGQLVVGSPQRSDGTYRQYIQNLTTTGWGMWRGVPMLAHDVWQSHVYFGNADNSVHIMDIDQDNVDVDGLNGRDINWTMLTAFSDLGTGGIFKRGVFTRADWISEVEPAYNTRVVYDYDFGEILPPSSGPAIEGDVWDVAVWDAAIWDSGALEASNQIQGSWGQGRVCAIALNGLSSSRATLLSTEMHWTVGHGL